MENRLLFTFVFFFFIDCFSQDSVSHSVETNIQFDTLKARKSKSFENYNFINFKHGNNISKKKARLIATNKGKSDYMDLSVMISGNNQILKNSKIIIYKKIISSPYKRGMKHRVDYFFCKSEIQELIPLNKAFLTLYFDNIPELKFYLDSIHFNPRNEEDICKVCDFIERNLEK